MDRPAILELEPVFLPKVWAAPEMPGPLAEIFAPPAKTGEVWLASHRHHITPVASGPLKGLGLDEVARRLPGHILGPEGGGEFPLLFKLLNVGQWLSVQVHPNDAQARELEGEPFGKSEAWHVLEAAAGAEIIQGVAAGADRAAFELAIARGSLPELLARVPAASGDTFHLPAGTVHATGPGLLILEIQQASDLTYRFYDWDRPDDSGKLRELHQDKALEVMELAGPGRNLQPTELGDGRRLLVDDPHFRLLRREFSAPISCTRPRLRLLFVLRGRGVLASGGESLAYSPGRTFLVPHGAESWHIAPSEKTVIFEAATGGE